MVKKDKGDISPKKRIKALDLQLGLARHQLVNEVLDNRVYKDVIVGLLTSSGLLKADSYVSFEKGVVFFEDTLNGLYIGTFLAELKFRHERLPLHILGELSEGSFYDKLKTANTTVLIKVPQLQLSGHAMPYIHRETMNVESTIEDVLNYASGLDVKD